jgi:hypothetical protein
MNRPKAVSKSGASKVLQPGSSVNLFANERLVVVGTGGGQCAEGWWDKNGPWLVVLCIFLSLGIKTSLIISASQKSRRGMRIIRQRSIVRSAPIQPFGVDCLVSATGLYYDTCSLVIEPNHIIPGKRGGCFQFLAGANQDGQGLFE